MPSTPRFIISSKNWRMRSGEAPSKSGLDPLHRVVEHAVPAHRLVVVLAQAVHVHAEGEIPRGREEVELLLEQDGVGAEVDVLLPLDQLHHQIVDVGIHEGLAARNAHDGGAALVHRLEALLDGEVLLEDLSGILDLAATRTREIAAEERLEHENQ